MKNYQNKGDDRRDGYAAAERYGGSSFKKKSFGDRDGGSRGSFSGDRDSKGGFGASRGGFGGDRGSKGGFGGDRGSKGGFGASRGGFGGDRGPVTMHKAVCTECSKDCEVPFKPTGDKPVLCQNCFSSKKASESKDSGSYNKSSDYSSTGSSSYSSPSSSNYSNQNSNTTNQSSANNNNQNLETTNAINSLKAQISDINFKLDKLTRMMEKIQQITTDNSSFKAKEIVAFDEIKISESDGAEASEINDVEVKEKKVKKVTAKKTIAVKKVATAKKTVKKVK